MGCRVEATRIETMLSKHRNHEFRVADKMPKEECDMRTHQTVRSGHWGELGSGALNDIQLTYFRGAAQWSSNHRDESS